MALLRIRERSNGKLYISYEIRKTPQITLTERIILRKFIITLDEAVQICEFTRMEKRHWEDQFYFLKTCKASGILPQVNCYALISKGEDKDLRDITTIRHLIIISGMFDEMIKYFDMFYLPKAESIFENLFHSQDWQLISPKSSVGNVAKKGFGISSLDSLENYIYRLRNGDFLIESWGHLEFKSPHSLE
jgi:hypothetical protein